MPIYLWSKDRLAEFDRGIHCRTFLLKTDTIVDKFKYQDKPVIEVYKLLGTDEEFDDWYIVQSLSVYPKCEDIINMDGMEYCINEKQVSDIYRSNKT